MELPMLDKSMDEYNRLPLYDSLDEAITTEKRSPKNQSTFVKNQTTKSLTSPIKDCWKFIDNHNNENKTNKKRVKKFKSILLKYFSEI